MKKFTEEQMRRVREFATMSDEEFYDKFLAEASLEEQAGFMKEFPEFMNAEAVEEVEADGMFRKLLEQIEKVQQGYKKSLTGV